MRSRGGGLAVLGAAVALYVSLCGVSMADDPPVEGVGGANGGGVDYGLHEGGSGAATSTPAPPTADRNSSAWDCDPSLDHPCDAGQHCLWQGMVGQPATEADAVRMSHQSNLEAPTPLADFELQVRVCSVLGQHGDFQWSRWVRRAEPPPDPAVLAAQVRSRMVLPAPGVNRSPDPGIRDAATGLPFTYVNLATWYWADRAAWSARSDSVSLRGVTVNVTAAPASLSYLPGDGTAVSTCPGAPGRPWTESDGDGVPADACAFVYRSVTGSGPIVARTSVAWSVSWTSNVGQGGQLDPLVVYSDSPPFLVKQIQVVLGRADG